MFKLALSNPAALRLLTHLPKSATWLRIRADRLERLEDEQLLELAFKQVVNAGGVTKQTHRGRFADADRIAVALMQGNDTRCVHDVAVSSGITSVDLYEAMHAGDVGAELFVSDKYAVFEVKSAGLRTVIFDADRHPVCSYHGIVYGDEHTSWKFPLSRWLHDRAVLSPPPHRREIWLFHPALTQLIDAGLVHVTTFDVFQTTDDGDPQYDYVRCMNLLNWTYFDRERLVLGIESLRSSLVDGGILQVGRTEQDGGNHVGFYRRSGDRLELMDRLGSGSEVHDLIAAAGDSCPRGPRGADDD